MDAARAKEEAKSEGDRVVASHPVAGQKVEGTTGHSSEITVNVTPAETVDAQKGASAGNAGIVAVNGNSEREEGNNASKDRKQ